VGLSVRLLSSLIVEPQHNVDQVVSLFGDPVAAVRQDCNYRYCTYCPGAFEAPSYDPPGVRHSDGVLLGVKPWAAGPALP
jgi:hypothetical protein